MRQVLQDDASLRRAYAFVQDGPPVPLATRERREAGILLDALARDHMAEHNVSYAIALKTTLNDPMNAKLKAAYAKI